MKNAAILLADTLKRIRDAEQQYQRKSGSVGLLAVSKKKPIDDILAIYAAGQTDFAENYLQEALNKIETIKKPDINWHFIGPVQSNKTRLIAENFQWVHSLDRKKIAQRLNDSRPDALSPLNTCLQVNISKEKTKSGIQPEELFELAEFCKKLPGLRIRGLMAIPEISDNFAQQRAAFKLLNTLFMQLQSTCPDIDTLSMGTSNDFIAAIAEGSTMVRIGTAIFGKRN